jgi:hypothetical protein
VWPNLALISRSSCLCLPSAKPIYFF